MRILELLTDDSMVPFPLVRVWKIYERKWREVCSLLHSGREGDKLVLTYVLDGSDFTVYSIAYTRFDKFFLSGEGKRINWNEVLSRIAPEKPVRIDLSKEEGG